MAKERRRAERLDANLFAEIDSPDGRVMGRAVVTDVSISGIGIETEGELPLNADVICHIEVPLNLRAFVVREKNSTAAVHKYGLKFSGLTFVEKFLVRRILNGTRKTRKI